jgi:hypothetical protein
MQVSNAPTSSETALGASRQQAPSQDSTDKGSSQHGWNKRLSAFVKGHSDSFTFHKLATASVDAHGKLQQDSKDTQANEDFVNSLSDFEQEYVRQYRGSLFGGERGYILPCYMPSKPTERNIERTYESARLVSSLPPTGKITQDALVTIVKSDQTAYPHSLKLFKESKYM